MVLAVMGCSKSNEASMFARVRWPWDNEDIVESHVCPSQNFGLQMAVARRPRAATAHFRIRAGVHAQLAFPTSLSL